MNDRRDPFAVALALFDEVELLFAKPPTIGCELVQPALRAAGFEGRFLVARRETFQRCSEHRLMVDIDAEYWLLEPPLSDFTSPDPRSVTRAQGLGPLPYYVCPPIDGSWRPDGDKSGQLTPLQREQARGYFAKGSLSEVLTPYIQRACASSDTNPADLMAFLFTLGSWSPRGTERIRVATPCAHVPDGILKRIQSRCDEVAWSESDFGSWLAVRSNLHRYLGHREAPWQTLLMVKARHPMSAGSQTTCLVHVWLVWHQGVWDLRCAPLWVEREYGTPIS